MKGFKLAGKQRFWRFCAIAFIAGCLSLWNGHSWHLPPVSAQISNPEDLAPQIYQKLPNLPLENQYPALATGQANPENTLIRRFIRYHLYVKSRPLNYRLDWKLTLADYLEANEIMQESVYPGYDTLKENPMEGDRAAIQKLNRAQRNQLVQVLTDLFTPRQTQTNTPTNSTPKPQNSPNPKPSGGFSLPKPGDAQLLR